MTDRTGIYASYKIVLIAVMAALMLYYVAVCCNIAREKVLVLEDVENKTRRILIVPDRTFRLSFIHSVLLTPVDEVYSVDESNRLILERVLYESFGVGMPYSKDNGEFLTENGKFVLVQNRKLNSILIRVSPIPRHSLSIGGEDYPLLSFVEPNNLIKIYASEKWVIRKADKQDSKLQVGF